MKQIREQVDAFVQSMLPEDPDAWCESYSDKKKIIHDTLWGTFELERHEVALVDTPLLQRLRFIHQTGAAYLLFPSARHTRFEHTLGVLFQAGKLCAMLSQRPEEQRMGPRVVRNIRLAAILHDTGHGPFSHTSEQFLSRMQQMRTLRQSVPGFARPTASEILSYLITVSKPMQELVNAMNRRFKLNLSSELIGNIIIGNMEDDEMYIAEVIHGPFDADKLDYMHRDGLFTGLDLHVDVNRLHASVEIMDAKVDGRSRTRLAGSMTGTAPLMQIMFNKILLYTSLYHHHKVRAVDCMLWAILDLAVERKAQVGNHLLSNPIDFLELTDDKLLTPELTSDTDIEKLVTDIRLRRLWKRALVISRVTTPEEMHEAAGDRDDGVFNQLVTLGGSHPQKYEERRRIASEIWKEAGKPCEPFEVWLDVPELPSVSEGVRMWISHQGLKQPMTMDAVLPLRNWVTLYSNHKWTAHVFCPPSAQKAINQASKSVLKTEFGLEFNPLADVYAKVQV